jgi:flagellar basal-body rod protein FlgG
MPRALRPSTIVNSSGYTLQPGITIPGTADSVSISPDGLVEAVLTKGAPPTQLGQLQLARFVNKAGLESLGDNLFGETAASGAPQVGTPNTDGTGDLLEGYLEMSNVNSVTEIADLIAAQRAYEMNARVISGADEMMQSTTQMR